MEKPGEDTSSEESDTESEEVSEEATSSQPAPVEDGGSFPWWTILCGLAVIALAVVVILFVRKK